MPSATPCSAVTAGHAARRRPRRRRWRRWRRRRRRHRRQTVAGGVSAAPTAAAAARRRRGMCCACRSRCRRCGRRWRRWPGFEVGAVAAAAAAAAGGWLSGARAGWDRGRSMARPRSAWPRRRPALGRRSGSKTRGRLTVGVAESPTPSATEAGTRKRKELSRCVYQHAEKKRVRQSTRRMYRKRNKKQCGPCAATGVASKRWRRGRTPRTPRTPPSRRPRRHVAVVKVRVRLGRRVADAHGHTHAALARRHAAL